VLFISYIRIVFDNIDQNQFNNALDPILYTLLNLIRFLLAFFFFIVMSKKLKSELQCKYAFRSLLSTYIYLFITTLLQPLGLYFGFHIGNIYSSEGAFRFGGFMGEPQTLSAWTFSIFLILYYFYKFNINPNLKKILIISIITILSLTQSTAWILAFLVFFSFEFKYKKYYILIFIILSISFIYDLSIFNKIISDYLYISERSITIIAGYELFISSFDRILFGYGFGLSPYLLKTTEIFSMYPDLDLSELGRQNVMNSYLELLFELGIIFSLTAFFLLLKTLSLSISFSSKFLLPIVILSPLLVGIFGIGGGFFSGYFILAAPVLISLTSSNNHNKPLNN
jgi:hypothetical protein